MDAIEKIVQGAALLGSFISALKSIFGKKKLRP